MGTNVAGIESLEQRSLLAGRAFVTPAEFAAGSLYPDVPIVEGKLLLQTGPTSMSPDTAAFWTTDGIAPPRRLALIPSKDRAVTYAANSLGYAWFYRDLRTYNAVENRRELWSVRLADGITRDLGSVGNYLKYLGSAAPYAYFSESRGLETVYFLSDGKSLKQVSKAETPRFESISQYAVQGEKYAYYDTLKNHVREVWQSAKDGSSRVRVLETKGPVALVPHEGKILIVDQKHTYLLNGRKGVAKPIPGGLKLESYATYGDATQFVSTGSHLIRLWGDQLYSTHLRTGAVKTLLSPEQQRQIPMGARPRGFGEMAYLWQVGRTDGQTLDPSFANTRVIAAINDRTFYTTDEGKLWFSQKSVEGQIFNDENADSMQDEGESVSPGRRVYVDVNNDGRWQAREPSDYTDVDGRYSFFDLSGKTARLRVVPDEDHLDPGPRTVRLDAVAVERNFALQPAGKIRVRTFGDANANGARDGAESWFYFMEFWIDLNRDGVLDAGEPSAETYAYTFGSLRRGTYQLRARLRTEDLAGFIYAFTTPAVYEIRITTGPRTREFGARFVSDGSQTP